MSKQSFPNTVGVTRPSVKDAIIMDINRFIGFIEVEGCFQVILQEFESKSVSISLRFTLTQQSRHKQLMESLINYLSCGRYYKSLNRNEIYFITSIFADYYVKFIPLFVKHPLLGSKQQDCLDFVKLAYLIKCKDYLTRKGIENIKSILNGMNNIRNNRKK